MFRYFVKRILLFIPSILLIGFFTFSLFHSAPNDPVEDLLGAGGYEVENVPGRVYQRQYEKLSSELKLDLPLFYFAIIPSYYPDTLYRVTTKFNRERAKVLLSYHNDWGPISMFLKDGHNFLKVSENNEEKSLVDQLLNQTQPQQFVSLIQKNAIEGSSIKLNEFLLQAKSIGQKKKKTVAMPKLAWFGASNQFHYWIKNFFTGNLGKSVVDGRPVWSKISKALSWTFYMVLIGISITLLLSIPLGVWSAYTSKTGLEKVLSNLFYFIYAMPLFWLATLLVVFFTTAQYGSWTNIFPSVGIDPFIGDGTTFSNIISNSKQLILPIFCIVIQSISFLSRLVRTNVIAESKQQYRITAQLKGLNKKSSYLKHLFPNSILPLITILVGWIPASFSGSLVLEVIFNIPGIGRLMYDSIFGNDWYVIFSIVMIVGIVTVFCYLIGDIIYSYINPKIRFGSSLTSQ